MKKLFTLIAVAAMAFAAQANTLTVCDHGGYDGYSNHIPVYGFWADSEGTTAQSIYPAAMLADMVGTQITEVKFYTLAEYYYENGMDPYISSTNFINFENAKIQLAFKVVDQNDFNSIVVGATPVATTVPEMGAATMTFQLDEPFTYEGGNLLVEAMVIEGGSFGTTYFYGTITGVPEDCSIYSYEGFSGTQMFLETFLPMVTFTYEAGEVGPIEPTEKTDAPSSAKENYVYNDGNLYYNAYTVTLIETEPSTIYYRVGVLVDGDYVYGEWMEYTGELNFDEEGTYMIEAYAVAEGKTESDHIWDGFTVSKMVDVEELFAGKTVANVRYFNLMGQEMQQANGVTIMVTTFTDGTTSAVKVVK